WGDYTPREGVTGLMQPTMSPLRDAKPMGDTLLAIGRAVLGSEEGKGPLPWASLEQYLRSVWDPRVKGEWPAALRQGGVFKGRAAGARGGRRPEGDLAARCPRGARVRLADAPRSGRGDPDRPPLRAVSCAALCRGAVDPGEPRRAALRGARAGVRRADLPRRA